MEAPEETYDRILLSKTNNGTTETLIWTVCEAYHQERLKIEMPTEEKDKEIQMRNDYCEEKLQTYLRIMEGKDKEIAGLKKEVENLIDSNINTIESTLCTIIYQKEIFDLKNQAEDLKVEIEYLKKGIIEDTKF